jgi:hypothetical protein
MSILEARSDGCRYCEISKAWYHSIRHCMLRTCYSHAMCVGARIQADLHQLVVFVEIASIQLVNLKIVANQLLPRHWQTKSIESVLVAEVLHLTRSQFGRRAAIRALEIVRRKIALAPRVCFSNDSPRRSQGRGSTYVRVHAELTSREVYPGKPDGAGLHCKSRDYKGMESHLLRRESSADSK